MCVMIISLTVIYMLIYCTEVKPQHTDKPEIFFRFQVEYGTNFTVEKYQPLDIVLDNFFAKYAWCMKFPYTGPDDVLINYTTFDGKSDSVMGVSTVTKNMVGTWWCVVLQEYKVGKPYKYLGGNYTAQNIVFVLRTNDKPEILFRFQEEYGTNFTVEKYQPLDIVLVNFFAKHAWCIKFPYTGPDDVLISYTTFDGKSDSVMGVSNVTQNMVEIWWCVVLQEYKVGKPYKYLGGNYTAQNIVFVLRTNDEVNGKERKSTLTDRKLYILSCVIGLATIVLGVVTIICKDCCCKQTNQPPLQIPIDPDSVFYLNLEIFRRQYERELEAQQEPEYEEID